MSVWEAIRKIRAVGTLWLPEQSLGHLETLRLAELNRVVAKMPPACRVLEIGAGSGWQARELARRGFDVQAIDIPASNYYADRVWDVMLYDGAHIPFRDASFDVVFSSNVLEHIPHVVSFQSEIHRVLKPSGLAIHVVPSASWRFWTILTHLLRYWTFPGPHGEHAANAIAEIQLFRRAYWEDLFSRAGWDVIDACSTGIFYTGSSVLDARCSIKQRQCMSGWLGSACHLFVLREKSIENIEN